MKLSEVILKCSRVCGSKRPHVLRFSESFGQEESSGVDLGSHKYTPRIDCQRFDFECLTISHIRYFSPPPPSSCLPLSVQLLVCVNNFNPSFARKFGTQFSHFRSFFIFHCLRILLFPTSGSPLFVGWKNKVSPRALCTSLTARVALQDFPTDAPFPPN